MKLLTLAVAGLITGGVSLDVGAQSTGGTMPGTQAGSRSMSFRDVDANGDGRITREEAQACPGLPDAFSSVDTRGLGYITEVQFNNWQRKNGARLPAAAP